MKNYQLKLIDSTYPVREAKQVLLSLIHSKIQFLNIEILSAQERFGSDTSHLEKRVLALRDDKERILEILETFQHGNDLVEIDCTINFKIHQLQTAD